MAGGIQRVFVRQKPATRPHPIHWQSGATSPNPHVPGRTPPFPGRFWHRLRRIIPVHTPRLTPQSSYRRYAISSRYGNRWTGTFILYFLRQLFFHRAHQCLNILESTERLYSAGAISHFARLIIFKRFSSSVLFPIILQWDLFHGKPGNSFGKFSCLGECSIFWSSIKLSISSTKKQTM